MPRSRELPTLLRWRRANALVSTRGQAFVVTGQTKTKPGDDRTRDGNGDGFSAPSRFRYKHQVTARVQLRLAASPKPRLLFSPHGQAQCGPVSELDDERPGSHEEAALGRFGRRGWLPRLPPGAGGQGRTRPVDRGDRPGARGRPALTRTTRAPNPSDTGGAARRATPSIDQGTCRAHRGKSGGHSSIGRALPLQGRG